MAKFHYDLAGAEAIIRDIPAYDSSDIAKGEFLMLNASSELTSEFITGYVGGTGEMLNGIGISNETIALTHVADWGDRISTAATTTASAIASIANTVTTGNTYCKAIINPFGVYLTEKDQGSGSYIICVDVAASTTVTDTVEDEFSGGWIYVVPGISGSTVGNEGQLRYISTDGGSSLTLLTAMTTDTTNYLVKIVPMAHELIALDSTAQMTSDSNAHTAPDEDSLRNVMSYITRGGPLEPLREAVHDGILDTSCRFYNDIIIKAHVFNGMEVI